MGNSFPAGGTFHALCTPVTSCDPRSVAHHGRSSDRSQLPHAARTDGPTVTPDPTAPDQHAPSSQHCTPQISTRRVDAAQVQKEGDDLARMAQTSPADVASVRKGMLPKDVIEKLKQIEKLSKRLRTELNP